MCKILTLLIILSLVSATALAQPIFAELTDGERQALYDAAHPYIKYFLDRAEGRLYESDDGYQRIFEGFTRSFQLIDPSEPSGSTGRNIMEYGASSYDQTIIGNLLLYAGDTTILDTYVEYSTPAMLADIDNPVLNTNTGYNYGPFRMVRIEGRDSSSGWEGSWDWNVDSGAAAYLIQYATDAYELYGKQEYKDFAVLIGNYILSMQDTDGGIRYGPQGMGPWYNPDLYWNKKSTEQNENCLLALEALFDMTGDTRYSSAAAAVRTWLKNMYDKNEHLYHAAMDYVGGSWQKTTFDYMPVDVIACAPLEMMFTDSFFGSDDAARRAEVDAMFTAINSKAWLSAGDDPLFFSFTEQSRVAGYGSVEWSSQMAAAYLEGAYYCMKQGTPAAEAMAGSYLTKYNTLMSSLKNYFAAPADDPLSLVAPYASYYGDYDSLAANVPTGTGYYTPNAHAALASAYYAIALTEGLKPWKYEYEDGEVVKQVLANGVTKFFDVGLAFASTADLDGSGAKDLVFNFGTSSGYWAFTNNSTWAQIPYTNVSGLSLKAATDLDGNGKKDLVFYFGSSSGYWAYENNSTWLQIPYTNVSGLTLQAVSDLNGNGQKDLVFNFGSSSGFWAFVDNATWKKIDYTAAAGVTLKASTDLDGNGKKDLVFDFGAGSGYWAFTNNSTWSQIPYTNVSGLTLQAVADLNGNGKKDLIYSFGTDAGKGFWAFEDNATWKKIDYTDTTGVTLMAAADLDGNGAKDLVFDFGVSAGYWYFANNTTWMQIQYTNATGVTLQAVADVDGNGKQDLVFNLGSGAGQGYWVFANGTTWMQVQYTDAAGVTLKASTDLDGNGQKDLVFDFGAGSGYWAFTNNSTWSQIPYTNVSGLTLEAVTDLDGNGKKDLLFNFGSSSGCWAFENNSTWKKIDCTDTTGVTMPLGDTDMIARMNLESSLNPQNHGSNYVMVGEMVLKPGDPRRTP